MQSFIDQTIQKLSHHVLKKLSEGNVIISKVVLGNGTFADVHLGYILNPKSLVALKMINKAKINQKISQLFETAEQRQNARKMFVKNIRAEMKNMKKVNHQNIIKSLDFIETQNTIYLILEYAPSGYVNNLNIPINCDLTKIIQSGLITFKQKIKYLRDIAKGLNHLYKKEIYHRDLKPQNVLIQNKVAKISDFGQSKSIQNESSANNISKQTLFVGTPYYRAIQILEGKHYSIKCDVWSFGVLIFKLFYGVVPWTNCTSEQMIINQAYSPLEFNSHIDVPLEVIQLIKNTIKINQNERYNAEQVLKCCEQIYDKYINTS